MDLTYATLLFFGGEQIRIYREAELAYIISDIEDPTNHLIYDKTTGISSSILHMVDSALPTESFQILKPTENQISHEGAKVWKMFFDGSCSKEGVGAGIVLISHLKESFTFSFKL